MGMAGGIRAGAAYIEFMVDSTKFVGGLNAVQNRLRAMGSSIAFAGAQLSAIGAAGLAGFLPAIKAASTFEERLNVFGTTFGAQTQAMRGWSTATADALGRSESQIVGFVSSIATSMLGLGFDDSQATAMSKSLTTLAVDLASFYNTTDDDALTALLAAFRGEADPIERYKVNVKQAAVNTKLLQDGLDPSKATEAQKAYARYALILEQTTRVQGDATKTSGSFANQMKRLQAGVEDAQVAIGSALLPALSGALAKLNGMKNGIVEWLRANPELVQQVFMLAGVVFTLGAGLVALGGFIFYAASALSVFTAPFALATGAMRLLGPLVVALLNPIGLLVAAVVGIGAAVVVGLGGIGPIFEWLGSMFNWLKDRGSEIAGAIGAALARGDIAAAANVLWATLKLAWTTGVGALKTTWSGLKNFLLTVWIEAVYGLASAWPKAAALLTNAWTNTAAFFRNIWNGAFTFIEKKWIALSTQFEQMQLTFQFATGQISQQEMNEKWDAAAQRERDTNALIDADAAAAAAQRNTGQDEAVKAANAQRDQQLAILDAMRQEELARTGNGDTAATAAAEEQLAKAQAEYEAALAAANKQSTTATEEAPVAPEIAGGDPAAMQAAADAANQVAKNISVGPLLGGERAGQVFGASTEHLAIAKKQLAAQEKTVEELGQIDKNLATAMALEYA